jgi:hypothetical protein
MSDVTVRPIDLQTRPQGAVSQCLEHELRKGIDATRNPISGGTAGGAKKK